ncbi:MAG: hypothetical protein FJ038_04350 [Chloroflexi bacterium]|nr:hypothetical protein [Chloroflexota bacterium]
MSTLIEQTRGHLLGSHRPIYNRLGTGMDASIETIELEFAADAVSRGSVLGLADELMYVWTISANNAVVQRGYLGTTPAVHAEGTMIEVNPRFPQGLLRTSLKNEIASWGQRIPRMQAVEVDVTTSTRVYELDVEPDFFHLLEIMLVTTVSGAAPKRVGGRAQRNYAEVASGTALILTDVCEGTAICTVAGPFDLTAFDDDTELEDDCGVPSTALDIPPLGAAWRVLSTREVARTAIDAQPEPRAAQDVQAGHIIQTARQLKALRDERIGEEGRLIQHRYGVPIV